MRGPSISAATTSLTALYSCRSSRTNTATGQIIADAPQAFAAAILFANFVSEGLVRAYGHGVSGIGVRSNGGYIENSGQIIATDDGGSVSWGICLGLFDPFNPPHNSLIVNTGLIEAQIAIDELYNGGVVTVLQNTGVLIGDINFCDGDNLIVNGGSLTGNVVLGAGADSYDGRGGTFVSMHPLHQPEHQTAFLFLSRV